MSTRKSVKPVKPVAVADPMEHPIEKCNQKRTRLIYTFNSVSQ